HSSKFATKVTIFPLETEVVDLNLFHFFLFWQFNKYMFFVGFNNDSTYGANGANRFTASTTNTQVSGNIRNCQCPFIRNHVYSLSRTVFRASTTICLFS